jgi:hypothetical protein
MKAKQRKLTVIQACEIMHTVGRKAKFITWMEIVILPLMGLPEMVAWSKMSDSYTRARENAGGATWNS